MWSVTGLLPQCDWSLFWGSRDSHTVKEMSVFFGSFYHSQTENVYTQKTIPPKKKIVDLWRSSPSSCCWFVSFLKQFSGSLNGKPHFFFLQRLARSVLRRVCMCVVFPIGKKNSVLRSHLMTRSLCTGARNENQGCVPQQGRHIGLERADRFSQTLGPNHKWERSRRGRGLLTCEARDPLNRMTWGKGVHKARDASRRSADCLQSETHGSCARTHGGSSRVHFAALLFSPQMRPLPVADPCLLPLHTVIAWQTNSAKVCAS